MGTSNELVKLLVVANPADGQAIASALLAAGLPEPRLGAGGEETLTVFASIAPDVVVLAASLGTGDSREIADAIQSGSHGPVAPIVLVGDEDGPVKTSLDAADFPIDRFVRRPISERALATAVRDCFREALEDRADEEAARLAAAAEEWDDAPSVQLTQQRILEATDAAINLFVSDAMSFVPESGGVATAPQGLEDLAAGAPARRETTEVLARVESLDAVVAEAVLSDDLVFEEPSERPAPKPSANESGDHEERGAFGRSLRAKMSEMAERLFPGQKAAVTPVAAEPSHSANTEFDLNELEDTAPLPAVDDVFADAGRESFESGETGDGTGVVTTRRRVSRLEPTRGNLEDDGGDPAALVARLIAGEASGKLMLSVDRTEKSVIFEGGRPVFATSNLPHDRMGMLLLREGKITRPQFEECKKLSVETGRRMGEILVEAGYLKPRELLPAVRRHLEDIFYSLMAWRQGAYVFERGTVSSERIRLSRHPVALIVEGIRRKYELATIEERLGGGGAIVIARPSDYLSSILGVSELSGAERALIDLFDGERTIDAAAGLAGVSRLIAYQLAYALVILSAAETRDRDDYRVSDEPVPSTGLVGERDLDIDRQRVLAKRALVDEADYFELLGVRRDATSFEIKRAYEAAMRDYRSEMFPVELQRDLGESLDDIGEALEEAYVILSDEDLRRSYATNLRG